ncbi:hypothetical protein V8F33_011237 [Rhypophila sp. PSN 637]
MEQQSRKHRLILGTSTIKWREKVFHWSCVPSPSTFSANPDWPGSCHFVSFPALPLDDFPLPHTAKARCLSTNSTLVEKDKRLGTQSKRFTNSLQSRSIALKKTSRINGLGQKGVESFFANLTDPILVQVISGLTSPSPTFAPCSRYSLSHSFLPLQHSAFTVSFDAHLTYTSLETIIRRAGWLGGSLAGHSTGPGCSPRLGWLERSGSGSQRNSHYYRGELPNLGFDSLACRTLPTWLSS